MPLAAGAPAPDFTLGLLDGGRVHLAAWLAQSPVLAAFFKTTCPTCKLAFPFLERIHQRSRALRVLAISQDPGPATRGFLDAFSPTLPAALDPAAAGYAVSNAYGITHVPSLFLISPAGIVEWFSTGFSKPAFDELASRAACPLFTPGDHAPLWQPG